MVFKELFVKLQVGKNVAKVLKGVDELATEGTSFGKDFIFAHEAPPKAIDMPLDKTVELDLLFDKVWNSIEAKNVGVIGLYGIRFIRMFDSIEDYPLKSTVSSNFHR
ncbi:hypothetical protein K1719_021135 [Acacia pycnantha]|nr:hypothetical protein K1719_021135 [Acacia pycnantha]